MPPRDRYRAPKRLRRLIPRAPSPTAAGVRTILDDLARKTPKARAAKAEDFIEPCFVKELDGSGPIRRLYGL